jgi:hypothetical protein
MELLPNGPLHLRRSVRDSPDETTAAAAASGASELLGALFINTIQKALILVNGIISLRHTLVQMK